MVLGVAPNINMAFPGVKPWAKNKFKNDELEWGREGTDCVRAEPFKITFTYVIPSDLVSILLERALVSDHIVTHGLVDEIGAFTQSRRGEK